MSEKICDKCNEVKSVECYYKSTVNIGGLANSCKKCYQARTKVRRDSLANCPVHKKRMRASSIKHRFNITSERYDEYLTNPCGICLGKSEVLDHCHETNKIRGALCQACNKMLGCAKDNIDNLSGGIEWLKTHQKS